MTAEWLSQSGEWWGRASGWVVDTAQVWAEPARARRLRQAIIVLFCIWAIAAAARLVWSLLPVAEVELDPDRALLNPVVSGSEVAVTEPVDINKLQGWHLFGEAAKAPVIDAAAAAAKAAAEAQQASGREGIEKGARKTRLDLVLRGVVASTDDGLGHAIIEHRKKQQVYAVEDKLPVQGRVFLAKVMPQQVVLDNGGTYELLVLFDESELGRQVESAARKRPREGAQARGAGRAKKVAAPIDLRGNAEASRLAKTYHQRLYQNPQSLAEVVTVTAVRDDGELRGYRVGPGKSAKQFAQLGFKAGDVVTGINGIALDEPANAMRLYQAMRSADEAVFELQRGDQALSLVVNLSAAEDGQ